MTGYRAESKTDAEVNPTQPLRAPNAVRHADRIDYQGPRSAALGDMTDRAAEVSSVSVTGGVR
ncbi:hypothetical protein TUM20985_17650 [Mycobacterium antarcticum]|nr:hypothetical protein TUM20985_17650 [Mycolicibacterium sp. TUM20985]GLP80367.1 hypothetical protein TUM20984_17870 [Mycolicibacterium sp. TUM20984]